MMGRSRVVGQSRVLLIVTEIGAMFLKHTKANNNPLNKPQTLKTQKSPTMAASRSDEEEYNPGDQEETAEEEEAWNEDESDDDEWAEEDDEEASLRLRSLFWLCQEGQIQYARHRFDRLLEEKKTEQLRREVFQTGRGDKNYALHELLMGGTCDRNANQLVKQILEFSKEYPADYRQMLLTQPPSHKRTPLHWAAWGNAKMDILQPLAMDNPEALVLKDSAGRTPAEIFKYYFCSNRNSNGGSQVNDPNDPRLLFLERLTNSWTRHRVRWMIHQCAIHHFVTNQLTPFDKKHRRVANMTPKPWFVLSILGTLMQREMKPLVLEILSYVGGNAKVAVVKKKQKRKLKAGTSANAVNSKQKRG